MTGRPHCIWRDQRNAYADLEVCNAVCLSESTRRNDRPKPIRVCIASFDTYRRRIARDHTNQGITRKCKLFPCTHSHSRPLKANPVYCERTSRSHKSGHTMCARPRAISESLPKLIQDTRCTVITLVLRFLYFGLYLLPSNHDAMLSCNDRPAAARSQPLRTNCTRQRLIRTPMPLSRYGLTFAIAFG